MRTDNIKDIGSRIKEERIKAGYSLEELANEIGTTRQSISKWEKGEGIGPTVFDISRLCNVFKCDFGYIVGDYECRTYEAASVKNQTGLSEKAVEVLCAHRFFGHTSDLELLSGFICYISKYPPVFDEKDRYPLTTALSQLIEASTGQDSQEYDDLFNGYMWRIQDLFMDFVKSYAEDKLKEKKQGG